MCAIQKFLFHFLFHIPYAENACKENAFSLLFCTYNIDHSDIDLVQGRAKQLYSAGFETLQSLTAAEPSHLVSKVQFLTHKAARQIVAAAKVKAASHWKIILSSG
jgi:hypothetical protein